MHSVSDFSALSSQPQCSTDPVPSALTLYCKPESTKQLSSFPFDCIHRSSFLFKMDSGKLVKSTPKLLLLKDYLLDDFSSCSSNGFRSYPRRQCCTTVRFLLEIDMKKNSKQGTYNKKPPKLIKNSQSHPKSSPSSPKLSAFQKASLAVINAVKHFPFPKSLSTQTHTKSKLSLIPRTLSKKLLKRTFWKKNDLKEIEPSKKKQDMVVVAEPMGVEKSNHPIFSPAKMVVVESNSSVTDSSKKSDSWSDSDFTVTTTSDDSFCVKNDVVLRAVESVGDDCESMEARTATTTMSSGTNSITNSEKAWTNEEKEQFSPVSILDCPFDDEDEVSSPFRHRLSRTKGATKMLKKKLQTFERLGQVEPMNLETKIKEHITTSEPEQESFTLSEAEDEECVEEEALNLLQLLKPTNPSYHSKLNADKLLSDFFRERLTFYGLGQGRIDDGCLLNEATNWINGLNNSELAWDWKVQKNRQAYVREMEISGEWKNLDEEIEEIASELETKVFASVMGQVLDNLVE